MNRCVGAVAPVALAGLDYHPSTFRIEILIVIVHLGQQRGTGLDLVFMRNSLVGLRSKKLNAVGARLLESVLKGKRERRLGC